MTRITFITADGAETTVDATVGDSVMRVARDANVPGIAAECGGAKMCATCHVYVDEAWFDRVGAAPEDEQDMLEFAASEARETSRLSCQITLSPDLDGLVVHLPESQI
ncbi:MAG: 2Fe-2S iron-sulfur cluster binding domain-containing protein [Rhodospirillum sp.]|nr:2Fe-2S iron-sulfur cluster binding domain-containing protein [Rhodospirillum sp.]MCF8487924.1 2Fe-2S iron-sulfur cluster binding domain-containing protein [Rhodospirillum sp.]